MYLHQKRQLVAFLRLFTVYVVQAAREGPIIRHKNARLNRKRHIIVTMYPNS